MHGTGIWPSDDISGWWISEKLDGWRCLWDGTGLFTRQGNPFNAPAWFKAGLPVLGLDGELVTIGTTTCDAVNSAVRAGDWHRLEYRPFDVPTPGMTFEQAQAIIAALTLPGHVRPVDWNIVTSTEEAIAYLRTITGRGGEGAMVRRPGSEYLPGRSCDLLKLKPSNPFLSQSAYP